MTEKNSLSNEARPGLGLLILGMHRSGTSALTGLLHILGANLGVGLVGTEPDINFKGYWENKDANLFDDRLLKSLGTDWYDVFDLPQGWCHQSKKMGFDDELKKLLVENFGGQDLWAVKDPRLCRLLPLWIDVAEQQEIELKFLMVLRHPFEVAKSLNKRNGFCESHAALLWLRYVLDSELYSRDYPRAIITFDGLLDSWKDVITEVGNKLNLGLAISNEDSRLRVEGFLDSRLRHHVSSGENAENPFLELANSAYQALQSEGEISLHQIRDEFNSRIDDVESWLKEANFLRQSIDQCLLDHREYKTQNEEMKNSRSWRWTAPLRALKRQPRN